MRAESLRWLLAAATLVVAGCSRDDAPKQRPSPPAPITIVSSPPSPTASTSASTSSTVAASDQEPPAVKSTDFARFIETLSEADSEFITDNILSNETSYLQVAPLLEKAVAPGGVYLGAGPEQNFSYIALTQPSLAFIVDLRRANLLLHLLYKAAFELASERGHFLALLLSREWDASAALAPDASIEQVIASVAKLAVSPDTFEATHRRLLVQLRDVHKLTFSEPDIAELQRTHRAFFEGQFQLAFALNKASTRRYPTLDELLMARDPQDRAAGFLGTDQAFRRVQTMQKKNRVIPVTGDFAGEHALRKIASLLKRRGLKMSAFYVSNVEQYLLGDAKAWARWSENLLRLPATEDALVIRTYLDQGKPHPAQLPGHRTTTVAQRLDETHRKALGEAPKSLLDLSSVDVL
jgi:hypothetical protein